MDIRQRSMTLETTQKVPLIIWKDGSIRIKGTRLPIDRIVYAYKNGESPEEIFDSFPSDAYTIADIYLIIAYYLQNKERIEKYLAKRQEEADKIRQEIEVSPNYQENRTKLREKLLSRKNKLEN